jgi:adenylate cyclase
MKTLARTLLKRPAWLYACVSALAVLVMASTSTIFAPQLQQWEERLSSRTWALADSSATERRVVVVDIDEKSTQALGAWPWPRDRMAQLLNGLDAYGVNLKVVDVLFDGEQNAAQDAKLASALKNGAAPTVISQLFALSPDAQVKSGQLASAMAMPSNSNSSNNITSANASSCPTASTTAFGFMAAAPAFAQSSQAVGHITPVVDTDGNIRRVPAVVCYEGQAYPALAVAALAAATGAQPVLKSSPGLMQSGQLIDVGGLQIPVETKGQLRVSYQMPRAGFVSVSAVDVIQGKVPAHMLKGAWALVGSTAFGGGDAVPTPQGGAVGGVEVHAQILSAALDARTPYAPAWAPLWPLAAGLMALLVLVFSLRAAGPKAAVVMPLVAVAMCASIFALHAALLLVWVDVMKDLPATLVLRPFNTDTLAVMAYQLARDERLGEAALPSLALVLVGLLPVLLLSRTLQKPA